MPFAAVNGQAIHYQDSDPEADPEVPTIILSHGFAMGHEMWEHQVGPLSEAGWRLHAGTNWLQFNPGPWRLGASRKSD